MPMGPVPALGVHPAVCVPLFLTGAVPGQTAAKPFPIGASASSMPTGPVPALGVHPAACVRLLLTRAVPGQTAARPFPVGEPASSMPTGPVPALGVHPAVCVPLFLTGAVPSQTVCRKIPAGNAPPAFRTGAFCPLFGIFARWDGVPCGWGSLSPAHAGICRKICGMNWADVVLSVNLHRPGPSCCPQVSAPRRMGAAAERGAGRRSPRRFCLKLISRPIRLSSSRGSLAGVSLPGIRADICRARPFWGTDGKTACGADLPGLAGTGTSSVRNADAGRAGGASTAVSAGIHANRLKTRVAAFCVNTDAAAFTPAQGWANSGFGGKSDAARSV